MTEAELQCQCILCKHVHQIKGWGWRTLISSISESYTSAEWSLGLDMIEVSYYYMFDRFCLLFTMTKSNRDEEGPNKSLQSKRKKSHMNLFLAQEGWTFQQSQEEWNKGSEVGVAILPCRHTQLWMNPCIDWPHQLSIIDTRGAQRPIHC